MDFLESTQTFFGISSLAWIRKRFDSLEQSQLINSQNCFCSFNGFAKIIVNGPEVVVKGKKNVSSVGEIRDSHHLAAGMHR